jgi:hypothetical protein
MGQFFRFSNWKVGPIADTTPSHSITSSARASSVEGTVRPSDLVLFEVDHHLVFGGSLYWEIGWLLSFQDAVHVGGSLPILLCDVWPISD